MKTVALSVVAVLAAAGSAMAQGEAAAAATLHLRIVPVTVTQASPLNITRQGDNVHDTVADTDTNRTRRFEVQYQIQEGAGFEGFMASLASLQFSVTSSVAGGPVGVSLARAALTNAQAGANSFQPVAAVDNSGNAAGAFAGTTGLTRAFRGGLSPAGSGGNNLPSNGTLAPGAINLITPLTLSQLNQLPSSDPSAWYSLFNFEVTAGASGATDALVSLGLTVAVDAQTQNAWGGYEDGDVIPRTSRLFDTAGASFSVLAAVPAPGSVALLGLGGLVATRRRRA